MHKALICSELFEAVDAVKGFDVVGIDEAQFFPGSIQI